MSKWGKGRKRQKIMKNRMNGKRGRGEEQNNKEQMKGGEEVKDGMIYK